MNLFQSDERYEETEDDSDRMYIDKYRVKKLSKEESDRLDDAHMTYMEGMKKLGAPVYLIFIMSALGLAMIGILLYISLQIGDDSYIEAADRFSIFYYGEGILFIAILCVLIYHQSFHKRAVKSGEIDKWDHFIEEKKQIAKNELGIPYDAVQLDVYISYIANHSNILSKNIGSLRYKSVLNIDVTFYEEDGFLCVSDLLYIWKIPLKDIKKIHKIDEKISFFSWNKNVAYNDESLKAYKIRKKESTYLLNSYFEATVDDGNECFELMIAPYDLDAFKSLIDMELSDTLE